MSKAFYAPASRKIAERIRKQIEAASTSSCNHNTARLILSKVEQLASAVTALDSQHRNPAPTNTRAYSDVQLGKNAKQLHVMADKDDASTRRIASEGSEALTATIKKKANLVPNEFAPEIRQAFRDMLMRDKAAYLDAANKRGDGPGLAAVLDAPLVLTGLTTKMSGDFRLLAEETAAPQECAERELLQLVWADAQAAISAARQAAQAFTDPARLRQIAEGEKAAEDADAQFREAVG